MYGNAVQLYSGGPDNHKQSDASFKVGGKGRYFNVGMALAGKANPRKWRSAPRGELFCLLELDSAQEYKRMYVPNHFKVEDPTKAETGRVVPTWNYLAVHVQGSAQIIQDPDWLKHHLHQLTSGCCLTAYPLFAPPKPPKSTVLRQYESSASRI